MPKSDKEALRRVYLVARRALPITQCQEWNAQILVRLFSFFPRESCPAALTYVSSKDNEVDTLAIITAMLKRGITVLVPITASLARGLSWSALRDLDHLARSPFGILEPAPGTQNLMPPPPNAPCLVPGIAFTPTGHRIGYGGGHFDRFLTNHRGMKIGLAYETQIIPEITSEAHDIPMDFVVTEQRVYRVMRAKG